MVRLEGKGKGSPQQSQRIKDSKDRVPDVRLKCNRTANRDPQ